MTGVAIYALLGFGAVLAFAIYIFSDRKNDEEWERLDEIDAGNEERLALAMRANTPYYSHQGFDGIWRWKRVL